LLLLTGFSLGCIAIVFLIVARDFGRLLVAKVFLVLLVASTAFLLNQIIDPAWKWLTGDIMTMIPALFWLLCQLAFARRPRLISIWAGLALYSFIAPAVTRFFGVSSELTGAFNFWGWQLPRYTEYVLILHGLWVIVASWSDDLITTRRQLRGALLGTVGFAALWVTISLNTGYGSPLCLPIVVSIAALVIAYLLLEGRVGVLLGPAKQALSSGEINIEDTGIPCSSGEKNAEFDDVELKLQSVMGEGFYRTERLTLNMLAEKIELPEYKTRALINQKLGYRNFNDYINQLRIAEAGDRLVSEPDTPILNIALDIGYRTLSSFNRAFKEIFEQSPTAYRQSKNDENQ